MVAVGIKKVAATHTSSYDTGLFFNAFSLRGLDPHVNISDLGWQSNFHDVFDANFRAIPLSHVSPHLLLFPNAKKCTVAVLSWRANDCWPSDLGWRT
jgi:hypothetical protein